LTELERPKPLQVFIEKKSSSSTTKYREQKNKTTQRKLRHKKREEDRQRPANKQKSEKALLLTSMQLVCVQTCLRVVHALTTFPIKIDRDRLLAIQDCV
jgi:hypothetical protein